MTRTSSRVRDAESGKWHQVTAGDRRWTEEDVSDITFKGHAEEVFDRLLDFEPHVTGSER